MLAIVNPMTSITTAEIAKTVELLTVVLPCLVTVCRSRFRYRITDPAV